MTLKIIPPIPSRTTLPLPTTTETYWLYTKGSPGTLRDRRGRCSHIRSVGGGGFHLKPPIEWSGVKGRLLTEPSTEGFREPRSLWWEGCGTVYWNAPLRNIQNGKKSVILSRHQTVGRLFETLTRSLVQSLSWRLTSVKFSRKKRSRSLKILYVNF